MKECQEVSSTRIEGGQYCIANELIESKVTGSERLHTCGSSDAMSTYKSELPDGVDVFTSYCFSCAQVFNKQLFAASSHATHFGIEGGVVVEKKIFTKLPKRDPITKDEIRKVLSWGYEGKGCRGIMNEYNQFFGHITKLGDDGEPVARYYPETKDGKLMGYKSRILPKSFGYDNYGRTGVSNDLSGQVKFKDYKGHRDLLIVGGECDKAAAFQMLRENQKRKGQEDYAPVAVVSPTTGEGSAVNQIRNNYDFVDGFENIILGLDNDEAGLEAMAAAAEILPKDKVKIIHWTYKDPNNMLEKGHQKQFMSDFYNAAPYLRDGIVTSKEADDMLEEELARPKMTLPEFMADLQRLMAGGVPLGYIVNWIAETGVGKSTLVNEAIRHWIFNSPYKVGILSLELTAAQYMIAMLSREVGKKINLFVTPEEALEFVRTPEVMEARKHLSTTEDGDSRFVLLDERDGDLEEVKVQCEKLINKYGCQVLIIDPIQDLFEGVSMDAQNAFIKWMKGILKRGVTVHNVCHVRKGNTSTDKDGKRILRELTEDDVQGISGIVKSGGANVFMSRDKYEESYVAKNTTFPKMGKCRWTGNTGRVDPWYYDNATHTMYDLNKHFTENPDLLPEGYDLSYNPYDKGGNKGNKGKESFVADPIDFDVTQQF